MQCSKFSTLEGCNKCIYTLKDNRHIPHLDTCSMIDILHIIMKECQVSQNTILLDKSTFNCTGDIIIVYDTATSKKCNKYICYEFIHIWLKYNVPKIYNAMEVIYLVLCACIFSCNEQEDKATQLIDSLQDLFGYMQQYMALLSRFSTF